MKRLVICFDGTWKRSQDKHVSNIEKIARTVAPEAEDVQQVVHYIGGVGSSYAVDRVLGGSLGLGMSDTIMNAYRFLALNYSAEDHVYVFGFSRGAFAARSLVGMINRVGVVTVDAMVEGRLADAEARYRATLVEQDDNSAEAAQFKELWCHDHVFVPFLGVFDTVEALGPRARFRRGIGFLRGTVAVGRQALAIDEKRRIFWPQLWSGDPDLDASGRLRQVWFDGYHSDVGGGVPRTGLSNTTLLWMAREAIRQGLHFDVDQLVEYLVQGSPASRMAVPENSMRWNSPYRLVNLGMRLPVAKSSKAFRRGRRVMAPAYSIATRIGSTALENFAGESPPRSNVKAWVDSGRGLESTECVPDFPSVDAAAITDYLSADPPGVPAAVGIVHGCPFPGCAVHP